MSQDLLTPKQSRIVYLILIAAIVIVALLHNPTTY